jgi:hypothetical protein
LTNQNQLNKPTMKRILSVLLLASASALAQNAPTAGMTTAEDHKNMMDQLGIKALRPGPNGNDPKAPNAANTNEALANPYPNLPELLTLKNGKKVTTADMWWNQRRAEIKEDLEREVIGRVPANIPKVTWEVKMVDREVIGGVPVIAKKLVGHVDNSSYPAINVDMDMLVVIPTNVTGKIPMLMGFGGTNLPAPSQPNGPETEKINAALKKLLLQADPSIQAILDVHPAYTPFALPAGGRFGAPPAPARQPTPDIPGVAGVNNDPGSIEQLMAAGWGYASISTGSIQADNGAGLTKGIIGLVNKGQPRKPDDWGALRAWAWGAARGLDYIEASEPAIDAKKVAIEGVSRNGKAALIALAFEDRFAMALVGSSGEGGAKLHRRNFGEAVESLTATGEYHWMAGNFMKYGASDAKFGAKTANDLPVDAHSLISLAAPRLAFISYGIPEKGDAKWLDQQGSYMATVAAGSVYKLLGAKDLGVSNDYNKEKMPPVNTPMLDGHLAWRQHDQGHQDQANMKWFIKWANEKIGYKAEPLAAGPRRP